MDNRTFLLEEYANFAHLNTSQILAMATMANLTEREKCALLFKSTNKSPAHAVFVYAQLLYVIPSMIYIKFLIAALLCGKNRMTRYSSIFYKFIAMGAWTAVLIHVPRSIFEIISKRPESFCPVFKALSTPTYWLDIYVYFIQVWDTLRILAGTMIVLYRFHSLVDVFSAKKIWEANRAAFILGTIAIPLVFYAPIWGSPSYARIDDEEMVFVNVGLSWYNNEAVHSIIALVCSAIVLLTQAYLIIMRTPTKIVGDEMDRALFIVGMLEIIVIPIYTVFDCIGFARENFNHSIGAWIIYVSLLVSDALGFVPAWALFIASPHIREDATPFRRLFMRCCRRKQAAITTPPSSSSGAAV